MTQLGFDFTVPEPRMRTKPYPHQLEEYNEHTHDEARALFWYMRTGKSKEIIDQACCLFFEGEIKALLVIAPNGVHENWVEKELPKHCWESVPYAAYVWDTKLKEHPNHVGTLYLTNRFSGLRVYTFPSSTLIHPLAKKYLASAIKSANGKVLCVFDEAHDFRTPGSKRTKWARAFSKRCKYRRILTGTPDLNSLLHYYSQLELLQPEALGFKRFSDFKARYADYEITNLGYPRLMGYKNVGELKERMMKFASVIRREDCEYLSAITRSKVKIYLTARQKKAQEVLNAKTLEKIEDIPEDDTFTLVSEIERSYIKHQQIASGYIIGVDPETNAKTLREIVSPKRNPRIQAAIQEVMYTTDQVIIWCQFRYDIQTLIQQLQQLEISAAAYYSGVNASRKRKIRQDFDKGKIRVFVGQPQSAGLGLDLSASSKIIWYSHTRNTIVRSQANERATAVKNANIDLIDFMAEPIDWTIVNALDKNMNVSEYIAATDVKNLIEDIKLK